MSVCLGTRAGGLGVVVVDKVVVDMRTLGPCCWGQAVNAWADQYEVI